MVQVRGSGVIEKDKRYRNTWKITFYLGEKDEQGRYKRAPKRTIHGSNGDAREALPAWQGQADAWYLDGFAPAKNPELWGDDLMAEVARHTAPGGTFATFAFAVSRALAAFRPSFAQCRAAKMR